MWQNPHYPVDLVTFTEEILNDTHMEELALYWIQYKNSLKYKVGCLPTCAFKEEGKDL